MIEKRKVVICNFCGKFAFLKEVGAWDSVFYEIPDDWKNVDKRVHYCPECFSAIEEVRQRIQKSEKENIR